MAINQLEAYMDETLGVHIQPVPWENAKTLPFLLRDRYEFDTAYLLKNKCLLMLAKGKGEPTPGVVKKHWDMAKEKWGGDVIYVPKVISTFNRGRLIDQKVPFIVPGKQLYLPDIGVDLREHVERIRVKPNTGTVSPATQVIILDALNHDRKEHRNAVQLAKEFGYTKMTITRVMDEIEELSLGTIQVVGRERRLAFDRPRKQLWEKAKPQMQNPVLKRVYVQGLKPGKEVMKAGLTALAEYSNLAEPENRSYAISRGGFRVLKNSKELVILPDLDKGAINLEIWRYWPDRLAQQGIVDRFSLFLSLEDDNDERVEMAKKMMMEKMNW